MSHSPKETEEMQSPELEGEQRKEEEEEGKRARGGREKWGEDKEALSSDGADARRWEGLLQGHI